jgi:O-antigen ligase
MDYLSSFRSTLGIDQASIHNPVLIIWSETGVLGMFLYLSVLGSAIWSFVRQYILHRQERESFLLPYIALISSVFLGYIVSWIKGGGMELGFSYFILLAFLLIPSGLETKEINNNMEINSQDVDGDKNLVMEASEQQPGWSHN